MKKIFGLGVVLSLCAPAIASVTFADGDFSSATTWQIGIPISATGSRISTGGNPGAYEDLNLQWGPSPFNSGVAFTEPGWVYDPSVSGAISSINASADLLLTTSIGRPPSLVLQQAGNVYLGYLPNVYDTVWTSRSGNLSSSDFFLLTGSSYDLSVHPDFSASGGAIGVSWGIAFPPLSSTFIEDFSYDNVSATFQAVPEPASFLVLSFGIAPFLIRRKAR